MRAKDIIPIDTNEVKANFKVYKAEKKALAMQLKNQIKTAKAVKKQQKAEERLTKAVIKAGGSFTDALETCRTITENRVNGSSQVRS